MRKGPRLRLASIALCLAVSVGAGTARGDTRDEAERWVPSFAFSFDVIAQPSGGSVESGDVLGPPIDNPPFGTNEGEDGCEEGPGQFRPGLCRQPVPSDPVLTPNNSGHDLAAAALVGLSLELMTPGLELPARPRLFAHADGALVFTFRRKLAGDGSPGTLRLPPPITTVKGSTANISEDTIAGQGNRVFSELKTPVVAAGAGVALTFDAFGRRLRVKPSFEYMMQEVEFRGLARRAVQVFGSNNPRPNSLDDYRLLSFSASRTRVHHGLGGGLEIEADTQRLGPFVLSVFIGGRVYHLLGDLDETLRSDQNEIGDSFPGEGVTWNFEPENLAWRGGLGVRFRFLPE